MCETLGVSLWQDIRLSTRSLLRQPALAATCVVVLALGVGVNTTIFTAIKAVVLDPLPFRDPGRLVTLYESGVLKGYSQGPVSPPNFFDWQREAKSFGEMAAYGGDGGNVSGESSRSPETLTGILCSWNLFHTLGIEPALGRSFLASDDSPKAPRTIILSDSLWRRRFGADPQIIGKTLRMDAQVYTIIGVMPASFEFRWDSTQFWAPLQL